MFCQSDAGFALNISQMRHGVEGIWNGGFQHNICHITLKKILIEMCHKTVSTI